MISVDRPAALIAQLRDSPTAQALARLATDSRPPTHQLVDELGDELDVRHLRSILVNTGVLPQRDELLEGLERWLEQTLAAKPDRHRRLVRPFAQWVLLRRARRRAQTRPITQASVNAMRSRVLIALHFLAWLDTIHLTLAELTQAHVDHWLDNGTTYHYTLRPFLAWARDRSLVGEVEVPSLPVGAPEARYPEHVQWQQLRRCLNDAAMPLEVRLAGSLLLLFGISASRQVQLHAEAVEQNETTTHLRVAQHALLLPPRLADIAIQQRDRTDLRSIYGRTGVTGIRWLFPGLRPGRPMDAHSIVEKLNQHGIRVLPARNTALAELAADLPPPVLAELVGIGLSSATRWAKHAQRDWSPYLAARIRG